MMRDAEGVERSDFIELVRLYQYHRMNGYGKSDAVVTSCSIYGYDNTVLFQYLEEHPRADPMHDDPKLY